MKTCPKITKTAIIIVICISALVGLGSFLFIRRKCKNASPETSTIYDPVKNLPLPEKILYFDFLNEALVERKVVEIAYTAKPKAIYQTAFEYIKECGNIISRKIKTIAYALFF